MTDRRLRDLKKLLENVADEHGAEFCGIEVTGGGHLRATLRHNGRERPVFMSYSPSDRYWHLHKVKGCVLRVLREMER